MGDAAEMARQSCRALNCARPLSASVTSTMESSHGKKYIVDGPISRPGGSERLVRSVWIVDTGETVPRLVTAYPLEGQGDD
jgi:hypothetical protein